MAEEVHGVCLVIAPIGDTGTDTRRRSDQVFRHVISVACEECGYRPERADKINESGFITSQIIQHVIEDAVVVADLTDNNPNVFYELAIRHAFQKPVIQIIKQGQKIPFDLAGLRTVELDHQDLDSVDLAKGQLINHMKNIQQKPGEVDSPVSMAIARAALRSGSPQERQLAGVLDSLSQLSTAVSRLEGRFNLRAIGSAILTGGPPFQNYATSRYIASPGEMYAQRHISDGENTTMRLDEAQKAQKALDDEVAKALAEEIAKKDDK